MNAQQARRRRETAQVQAARRRRDWRRRLGIAVVVAVVLVAGVGALAVSAASRHRQPAASPTQLAGLQTGPAPWGANTADLAHRLQAIGVPPLSPMEGTAVHIHQHLDLYVDGHKVVVPAGIGIDPAVGYAPLHTHDPSGVIHVESPTLRTYTLVALLSLGLITTIAAFQSGRLLAPLRVLEETARDITATDLSRRIPEQGNDDITDLTRTINRMLERLDAGFSAQRQFLDDAGHELKTPLTVVRGHLELLDPRDPDDLAETRELLLDEVDRMSRLVTDLILLAKSRRPDFLVLGEVELSGLTRSVLAKATALGDRAWRLDEVARGRAVLDEQRITQALLQLADNAVKHTDPGAEVAIGSARGDGEVRLWVRDAGDGIPAGDRAAVLERFGRSQVRAGDDGFGLGLSIVRAIADAHGGDVRISDAPPRGAHVEVVLPDRGMEASTDDPRRKDP